MSIVIQNPNNMAEPESPEMAPYVVSADVHGLMDRWARQNGILLPSRAYFDDLGHDLLSNLAHATGADVEMVTEDEMTDGLAALMSRERQPIISFDRAYFDTDHPDIHGYIDATRGVYERQDEDGNSYFVGTDGLVPRPGFPSLDRQLEAFRATEPSPITLLDDVIFSGDGAVDMVKQLAGLNRPVTKLIAGIVIDEGLEKLEAIGVEVQYVKRYAEVADEVCARDFMVGVPMSGRTVYGDKDTHWSAPYLKPYGDPEGWGSIPAHSVHGFSRFCIAQSIDLWHQIGELSGRHVSSVAVPRLLSSSNSRQAMTVLLQQQLDRM